MEITIRHVGVYRNVERRSYLQSSPVLSLAFSGYHYLRSRGVELYEPGPFIIIHPGGEVIEMDCDHRRESWSICFSSPHIHQASQVDRVEWYSHGSWVSMPKVTPLPGELVPIWRMEMERLRDAFLTSLPQHLLRIETGLMNILRFVLDQDACRLPPMTPAMRLKQLIDDDEHCTCTLGALSEQCGYAPDYLRNLFEREFGVSPLDYRNRRRMARAMELIVDTQLSVSEIAVRLGYQYRSHFSMAFRTAFQLSPTEAIRSFRQE